MEAAREHILQLNGSNEVLSEHVEALTKEVPCIATRTVTCTATRCNTLQHTITLCNALQRNTLQRNTLSH